MKRKERHLEHIKLVATSLGALLDQVVFTGGAIVGLFITDTFITDVRPTDDVDLIVEITTYAKYADLQKRLRDIGFVHSMDGPNCRFNIHGVQVDIMPTSESILGFRNEWYPLAASVATPIELEPGMVIKMITAPLFICTKLEAFFDRGKDDYIGSHDLEDIIAVIDGREELESECGVAPQEAREYLSDTFTQMLKNNAFRQSIECHLPSGDSERVAIVLERITALTNLK